MQKYGRTALMVACKKGHTDIAKLLLAVPGVEVDLADVSCVSGRRLHAVISHCDVHCELDVSQEGLVRGQGEPGGGLRGRRAMAGVVVCRSVGGRR
jgi:hypothetical protein